MSGTTMAATDRASDGKLCGFDRMLSRLLGAGGLTILAMWLIIDVIPGESRYAGWWLSGQVILAVLFLVVAAAPPRVLTVRFLEHAWVVIPALGVVLQTTAFIAESRPADPSIPAEHEIWQMTWLLGAVYLSLLALRMAHSRTSTTTLQLVQVNLFGGALALGPVVGFWLEYRQLPFSAASAIIVQLTNVTFPMLLLVFRTRMISYFAVQERWRQRTEASAAAKARLLKERELARLAHDTVLGTLNSAALWFRGDPVVLPEQVVDMARGALRSLDARTEDHSIEQPLAVLEQVIVSTAAQLGVELVEVRCADGSATVPGAVVSAVSDAMSEAVRNSVRHAAGTTPRVAGSIQPDRVDLMIEDDGPGFDLAAVPLDRMGVRQSIVRRMTDLPGGDAVIDSAPGRATRVRLAWRRPASAGMREHASASPQAGAPS